MVTCGKCRETHIAIWGPPLGDESGGLKSTGVPLGTGHVSRYWYRGGDRLLMLEDYYLDRYCSSGVSDLCVFQTGPTALIRVKFAEYQRVASNNAYCRFDIDFQGRSFN